MNTGQTTSIQLHGQSIRCEKSVVGSLKWCWIELHTLPMLVDGEKETIYIAESDGKSLPAVV